MSETGKSCCTPSAPAPGKTGAGLPRHLHGTAPPDVWAGAVAIPGGRVLVGTSSPVLAADTEGPLREQRVAPFRLGRTTVTNDEFRRFVEATGYVTEAEEVGWSFVFWAQVPKSIQDTRGIPGAEWWRQVFGANWRDVNGPGTEAEACLPDHPVVQVSWNDARAYADWAGGRLPSEAEWEHAARGGLGDVKFPWGDAEPDDDSHQPCNIWQGRFPQVNTGADGYRATAPAHSFAANGYGLFNMVGNVWEWSGDPFRLRSLKQEAKTRQRNMKGYRLTKGGSFLCHRSYCYRYRIAARSGSSPDSATTHQGFRVAFPA